MQTATTVLSVIQKRGIEQKPLDRMYRQLFNMDLYKVAYSQIYANAGAITKGSDDVTLDGTSIKRFEKIIAQMKTETYRWKPVRRTHIPKKNGKTRPLGIPSGDDKLVQAVMRNLLEAYYEPQFSNRSHGFRPGRGCHTALVQISQKHRDTSWFIEGDIKGFFDNINHEKMVEIVGRSITDERFLNLLRRLLQAGYMEDWKWNATYSGTPQGGIISPLLSNIYLDVFDKWVENELLPLYNKGKGRKRNPEWRYYEGKRRTARKNGDAEAYKRYSNLRKGIPSVIDSEGYRKLEYVRYADDFLLSFAGPKAEAEEIKGRISDFLRKELAIELSGEKTLITHARTEKARFLGYDLKVMHSKERPSVNGAIWYGVPREVIAEAMKKYMKDGKPVHRPEWLLNSDFDIIANFQSEYRGLVQYYIMAHNLRDIGKLEWVTTASLLKTLAGKHKTKVSKVAKKYKGQREMDGKTYRVFTTKIERKGKEPLVAHYGAIPLKRNPKPVAIRDEPAPIGTNRSELIDRLQAEECEMCGKKGEIQVHHVRKLKDLNRPGRKSKPEWMRRMAAIRRKTLMVCNECHDAIHTGQHRNEWDIWKAILESRVR
jgi:group II intron reverse transcriptase/maturase